MTHTNQDTTKAHRLRRCKLTAAQEQLILNYYAQGHTYKEITAKYGFAAGTIARIVRGTRSAADARKLSESRGRWKLTNKGRQALIQNGKMACMRTGKIYTKPEREFINILNGVGIGVRFPALLKQQLDIPDTGTAQYTRFIFFQYPIQRYVLDFVDVDNKIAINIHGDYWHANPILYDQTKLGKIQKHNTKADKNKRIFLEHRGWTILDIWQSQITWNTTLVTDKLWAAGITEARRDYTPKDRVQFPSRLPDWSDQLKALWHRRHYAQHTEQGHVGVMQKQGICQYCGKQFSYKSSRAHKYCSKQCVANSSKRFKVTSEQLLTKLEKLGSYTKVGQYFCVSDTAVKKRCIKLGILQEASRIINARRNKIACAQ